MPQSLRQEGGPHATFAPSQDNGVFHTILSKLKCRYRQHRQHDAYEPEAGGDLRLRDRSVGPLQEGVYTAVTGLLVVVVEGGHLEDPLPHAGASLGVSEVGGLDDHRERLHEEDAAEDRQEQLLADHDGKDGDDAAQRQAPRVAHKDLCGERIEP